MKRILLIVLFFQSIIVPHNESCYEIAVGQEDKERLIVDNDIYNPFSFAVFEKYIKPGDTVLEVGCGIGLCAQKIAECVGKDGVIVAVDASSEQIEVAQNLKKEDLKQLTFHILSAEELVKLNKKFDVVYLRFVLVHVKSVEKVVQQIQSVLKSGGKVIIDDGTLFARIKTNPKSEAAEIVNFFTDALFEIQKTDLLCFEYLPKILIEYGFLIEELNRFTPLLQSYKHRSLLLYNLSSLKNALITAGKITDEQYYAFYNIIEQQIKNQNITFYGYQMGQIIAQLK